VTRPPGARQGHNPVHLAWRCHPFRRRCTRCAGGRAEPEPRGDTWAWFDQSWRQIQDIGPAPRRRHAMDPAGKIIAFGGETAAGTLAGDTWELAPHS